jgi:hypothetical protein
VLAHRIDVDQAVLDFPYGKTETGLPRPELERRLKTSYALNILIREAPIAPADQVGLVAPVDDLPNAAIVLISHNQFVPTVAYFLEHTYNRIAMLTNASFAPFHICINDRRAALFTALRAAPEGKMIVLSPDAKSGTFTKIQVLGTPQPMGVGAAFLAYESRLPTYWFNLVWRDGRFLPNVVARPVREGQEAFETFQARIGRFYQAVMNDHLTGDPLGIVASGRLIWFARSGAAAIEQ